MIRPSFAIGLAVLLGVVLHLSDAVSAAMEPSAAVVALVNGEPVTEAELEARIRRIHQYKPRLRAEGEAAGICARDIVDDLVADKLMAQEAKRLELDRDPGFVRGMEAFASSQAVIRLRDEEVTRKIAVTELEIVAYFRERFENVDPAHQGKLERFRGKIMKILRKIKEKELAESFVASLRARADVRLDQDMLALCRAPGATCPADAVVARVDGVVIAGDILARDLRDARRQTQTAKGVPGDAMEEKVLDQLVTFELVRQEALRRGYAGDPAFAAMLAQRREEMLLDIFRCRIVAPLAVPGEEALRAYYQAHLEDFVVGREVRFSGMRFRERGKAEAMLREIRQGADVAYLARNEADGAVMGGNGEWTWLDRLERPVARALGGLAPGETSDVLPLGRQFALVTLREQRGGKPLPFDKVAGAIRAQVTGEAFDKAQARYLDTLRGQADISVREDRVAAIEAIFWKKPGTGE